jgi:hypothetical protein
MNLHGAPKAPGEGSPPARSSGPTGAAPPARSYTHYDFDDGDLMLRIGPRRDGAPLVVEVRSLTRALAEANRILALA